MRKHKRTFRIVPVNTADEEIWNEYWKDKKPEEKLNAGERTVRGVRASQRLQRVFRTSKRT